MALCRCGCEEPTKGRRVFIDKEHQLRWMRDGGARELNQLQPIEAKQAGGTVSGMLARDTGRLAKAAVEGGRVSREIAERGRRCLTGEG
jgi:hypothetical protein